jgi:L-fuconolactonase
MKDLSIADTHVHLWNLDRAAYPWLEDLPKLNTTHGLTEYHAAIGDAPVDKMVFVECTVTFDDAKSRAEVEWVESLAEQDSRLQGIVAHASLEQGEAVRPHLEWLSQRPLVKGVRRLLQNEDNSFFRRPSFVEGVQTLAEFGFSFDLTVRASQLPAVIDLVDQCPEVKFVLDHIGKPDIQEEKLKEWSTSLEALADRPNVTCKISGVLTEADLEAWSFEDVEPYLDHALNCFGSDRVMFGSDWPVVRLAATYPTWLDVLESVLQGYSTVEKRKLFRTNAERVYQLK